MAVRSKNAHYLFHTIHLRHWQQLALQNGGVPVWHAMLDRLDAALAQVETALPDGFPQRTWSTIAQGARSERDRLLTECA